MLKIAAGQAGDTQIPAQFPVVSTISAVPPILEEAMHLNVCRSGESPAPWHLHDHTSDIANGRYDLSCAVVALGAFFLKVRESTSRNHIVTVQHVMCLNVDRCPDSFVDWGKILIAIVKKLFETLNHEIGLLEIVDQIFSPHDPFEFEDDPIGRIAF